MNFRRVAKLEDLWNGEMNGAVVEGKRLILINIGDRVYAYADACPHQRSRLSEGTLTKGVLRCARHHWEFDACTGVGINPASSRLKSIPIKIDGEDILVDVDMITDCASETERPEQ